MAPASPTVFGTPAPRYVRSRTQSISSDRPSTVGHSLGLSAPPSAVSPEPEFIAASAAAQIVTNDHDNHAGSWYDQNGIEAPSEPAFVTPDALQLVNAFLDQLLFNFLQLSRSTNLSALRPAVSEILKPKLAKDTIGNADEELREYLGSGDEDDYSPPLNPRASRDWDVELAWKRTRLRCMVYSSLGDMEEEDEDLYMEQENLEIGAHEQASDVISPAAAIFLTSVLEYMGELTLTVAGQVSYNRIRAKIEKDIKDGTRRTSSVADSIIVGEMDMERVALDRTLGRLWRGWKKRMRHPGGELVGHSFPTDLMAPPRHDFHGAEVLSARSGTSDSGSEYRRLRAPTGRAAKGNIEPSHIPLPLGDRDVDEIEVPGLAHYSDDELDEEMGDETKIALRRPKSLIIKLPVVHNGLPTPTMSQPQTPVVPSRKRANSLPTPAVSPFHAPKRKSKAVQSTDAISMADLEAKSSAPGARETPHSGLTPSSSGATATSKATMASSEEEHPSVTTAVPAAASAVVAAAAATGAAAVARRKISVSSNRDEEDEAVTYETAEIVTSSRVSIAGSSASASLASESGKASTIKRSSSVHSARIVDVTGPRSPAHSRHTSVDTAERARRISPSGLMNSPRATPGEIDSRAKTMDRDAEMSGYATTSRASIERKRHSRPAATSISESDEDYFRQPKAPGPSRAVGLAKAAPIIPAVEPPASRAKKEQVAASSTGKTSPMRREPVSNVKVSSPTILNVSTGPFRDDAIPEVAQKAAGHSGRHSPKADGRGMTPIERSRTRETDEEPVLPTQSNVTPRQIHTSASSASSGTSKLKPVRASEDNSSRAESVARNFEELIQSNQTITYTLTPENMRDIDSKRSLDSPVVTKFSRKSEEARGQQTPRSSPTAAEAPKAEAPKSPLSHHPVSPSSPRTGERRAAKPPGPVPRVPAGIASPTGRAGGPEARDARTHGESTADFAQFIKCTGPAGEKGPPRPQSKTPTSPIKSSVDFGPVSPALSRERYQPREAAVDNRGDSSDLIDFIRQGPPIAASNHRIPRHVAPFRSTMDSDHLVGAVGGMAVDATIPEIRYSQGSTNMTENSMPSMQSSINSNSALLNNKGAPGPSAGFDDEAPMPRRKQRRVRDPYAIDLSDEEDEDEGFAETPKPPARKEESLAEFLRNYEPPPEPPSEPPRLPRKKSSAPSLIGRFTRNGSRETKDSNGPSAPVKNAPAKPELPSLSGRTTTGRGGYIPIQVNMPAGYDKYGATDNQISRPRMTTTSPSAGRVPMKKFEPREAIVSKSQTSDLAAFLRDSAPPDMGPRAPARRASASRNSSRQDDGNGLSKMFGRKKKSSAT